MKSAFSLFFSILIFFNSLSTFAQNFPLGWFSLGTLSGDSLTSVFFNNNLIGWTVGKGGRILKTTNGGTNWNAKTSGTFNTLEKVMFTSINTGYCIGGGGTIIKTIDGGVNWNQQISGTSNYLKSASFVNDSVGFAVGLNNSCLRSINGGNNWNNLFFSDSLNFYSVYFINSNTGWLSAEDHNINNRDSALKIFKTTNGGDIWSEQSSFERAYSPFLSLQFTDSLNGWMTLYSNIIDASYLYKTTNSGLNWTGYSLGPSGTYSIFFSNSRKGWGVGPRNRIYYTIDGGITWTNSAALFASIVYSSVFFVDSLTGWAVSRDGMILKTTTGGILTNFSNPSLEIPDKFSLSQNYPNPFNPNTIINYELPITSYVSLKIFDVLGNEIATLVNEKQNPGSYNYQFSTVNYQQASGIYFYTLTAGDFKETKRMLLIK